MSGQSIDGKPAVGRGRIFSIAPGAPFLKVLARAIVDGELVPGFVPRRDPLLLADVTIYLPTRRAARALSAEFIDAFDGRASLIPSIRTLGDGDDEDFDFAADEAEATAILPPIPDLERRLCLARLIRGWTGTMSQSTRDLFGDEDIATPSSTADAIRMAQDLSRLMDSMATEEIGWQALDAIAGARSQEGMPERWAQWWNLTLHFLEIVSGHWPYLLADAGRSDPAQHRGRLLELRTRRLLEGKVRGPVIAAGSTGSIPATAGLIKAIAGLEQGAVVLPGADLRLDKGIWEQLSRPDRDDDTLTACTHPQYGLARLLKAIGIDRSEIAELGEPKAAGRMRLVGQALLPAQQTMAWGAMATHEGAGDIAGTALVEAPDGRMEALAIAIALRETLEVPGKTAALVTPDRMLAQRVAAELGRFAIAIDDSAGTPLSQTQAAGLARLALSACLGPADPVTMAALVKHPAVSGQDGAAARHARLFELAVLRDAIVTPAPGALAQAARRALGRPDRNRRAPSEVRYMLPDDAEAIVALGARIDAALSPLVALAGKEEPVPVATAMEALSLSVRALAAGEQFFAMPGADELQRLFDDFVEMETGAYPAMRLDILPAELPEVFDALVAPLTVRDTRAHHPRLSILGPLEARLQQFDRMILGGLNEGTWPGQARNDPFLNRPMKAELGLSTPERRIGQAAHDFQQLSGASEVIYTRSMRSEGAPTVASRWLQRLLVVAGEKGSGAMRAAGSRYLALANALDTTEGLKIRRVGRPNPKPAVELRPTGLSVTDIETWIRDPYAIHAKHVLKLRPLPPLERQADTLLKGLIYHSILARHVTGEDRSLGALEAIARQVFAENNVPADVAAAWLPRFMAVAGLFAEWEAGRRKEVVASHCEIDGSMTVENTGFTLRGRADRIDVMSDGSLAIIDYKTGTRPSVKEARSLSPQLALEGKMAEAGAFRLPPDRQVGSLSYVRLRKDVELPVDEICGKAPHTPAEVIGRAWSNLLEMIGKFQDPGWGYLSRRAPSREGEMSGDYDHLARVREWSSGDPEGGDD